MTLLPTCASIRSLLPDLLDDLLDADVAAEVVHHLDACTACQGAHVSAQRLRQTLGRPWDVAAPAGDVGERALERHAALRRSWRRRAWVTHIAAAAGGALVACLVLPVREVSSPASAPPVASPELAPPEPPFPDAQGAGSPAFALSVPRRIR